MPRPIGLPKTGGRQKGTPNQKSAALINTLESLSFNPVKELVEAIQQLPPSDKAIHLLKFMEYVYPKQKSLEVETTIEERVVEVKPEYDLSVLTDDELDQYEIIMTKLEEKLRLSHELLAQQEDDS